MLLLAAAPRIAWANCLEGSSAHQCLQSANAVEACTQAVNLDSLDTVARRSLCEAHYRNSDFDSAAVVLQQGISECSGRACRDLKLALSNVDEQRDRANRADPDAARRAAEAQRAYCMGPIANQRSISACEKILVSSPKDAEILLSLGTKLNKKGRPAQALMYLQRAERAGGPSTAIKAQVAKAAPARNALVTECLRDTSLSTCDAALLPGARDEADVQRHRGKLLIAQNRTSQARRALTRSWALRPKQQETAKLIVQLGESAFSAAGPAGLLVLADAHSTLSDNSSARSPAPSAVTAAPVVPDIQPETIAAPAPASVAQPDREQPKPVRPEQQTVELPEPEIASPPVQVAATETKAPPPESERIRIAALNSVGADGRTH